MNPAITQQIRALPNLDKAQLLLIWVQNFSHSPPPKLRKELMVPILAYRIQEKEYGGLSHGARKKLREIAQTLGPEKRPHASIGPSLKTGARLIRSWKGEVHEVNVLTSGFEYRGQHFVEHWNPVRASALHHYMRNPFRSEPLAQTHEIGHCGIETPSLTSRLFVSSTSQHAAKEKSLAYVDSSTSLVDFSHTLLLIAESWREAHKLLHGLKAPISGYIAPGRYSFIHGVVATSTAASLPRRWA